MVFIKHHSRKYATSPSCYRRRSSASGYTSSIKGKDTSLIDFYTPGIYADEYIVFAFAFVRSYVRKFVRNSVTFVEFASKFCVKVSQVVYISATTYQKAFIFGP